MSRPSRRHVCSACGASFLKWAGRCQSCGEWNSLVAEDAPSPGPKGYGSFEPPGAGGPLSLPEVGSEGARPLASGVPELDRVLGGGFVAGSVTLLGGEPGIGKSTLVLQAATSFALAGARSLVVAAEESAEQVRRRAERLGALPAECFLFSTGDLLAALGAADRVRPALLVIDSIQALSDGSLSSPAGSPTQVRECAQLLAQYAKATRTATVLVGHVTKDGSLAGPRALEHLVDTVLSFEGDRHHALRALVATKHRYGAAGEIGLFEMGESGLASLEDPSTLLLADRRPGAPGSSAFPALEGRRPLMVELQALLAPARGQPPRRVVQGASASRVAILLAVLERFWHDETGAHDLFLSSVGGIKVSEPAADLPLALAIASSLSGHSLPEDVVAFGEVGLGGELRQASRPERRLTEAWRLGFGRAVAPLATPDGPPGMRLERVATLRDALALFELQPPAKEAPRRRLEALA